MFRSVRLVSVPMWQLQLECALAFYHCYSFALLIPLSSTTWRQLRFWEPLTWVCRLLIVHSADKWSIIHLRSIQEDNIKQLSLGMLIELWGLLNDSTVSQNLSWMVTSYNQSVQLRSNWCSDVLGGCLFNGPLSVMKYPTRESPRRDAASPIKYNGLRVPQPTSLSHCAQPAVPYRNIIDWPAPAVLVFNGCSLSVAPCISTQKNANSL